MKKLLLVIITAGVVMISCKSNEKKPSTNELNNSMHEETMAETSESLSEESVHQYTFIAIGNEPFWNLEINREKIVLRTMQDTLSSAYVEPVIDEAKGSYKYIVEADGHYMLIEAERSPCSDTMSDNSYHYSVNVWYKTDRSSPRQELMGCGWYNLEKNLEGNWVLQSIEDNNMQADDFGNGLPNIVFNLKAQSFNGSTGCNRMNGDVVYGPGIFKFERVMTTKALCSQGQENEDSFMRKLSEVNGFTLDRDNLAFTNAGTIILSFKRSQATK